MNITSLILRRRYPVPVTLDDLYRAIVMADMAGILTPEAQRENGGSRMSEEVPVDYARDAKSFIQESGEDALTPDLYTFKGARCFLWGCELFDNEADARRRFG